MITTETSTLFTTTNVVVGFVASAAVSLFLSWLRAPRYPKDIPWVGEGKGLLAALREMRQWMEKGYEEYSKNGRMFIVPGLLGTAPEVVIPRSQMRWMLDQPDNVASTAVAHYDSLNGEYSFVDKVILRDPFHEHVIHRTLARHLTSLVPAIDEEVQRSVDNIFGSANETEWKTINIWDSLMEFVPPVTNRILVGRPLCDNKEYIQGMVGFSLSVTRDIVLHPLVPFIIKPIVCRILGLSSKYNHWKTAKHSVPVIKRRLEDMAALERGDPEKKGWQPPDDYITWQITIAKAEGRTDELNPHRISQRLMPINFGSIHTTVLTGLGAFLDMLSHDVEQNIVASIREEIQDVKKEEGDGFWTKTGLAKLHRLDSAIRESMRISGFSQTLVARKVVAPEGLTDPISGQHFAYGTTLSCPVWGTHHDADLYGDTAESYDAFRYSRERERVANSANRSEEALKAAQMGMVTTSVEHFPFGHGRHACPGRFFVAIELKALFAYVLMNYDLKPLKERPMGSWAGKTLVPATHATMEIRRRKQTM
ncbi:hypothetical protein N0V82_010511 [Gnomoniopsis sp. IMI 355080]|nr:hypothetical protein N0V82_010511 [Gnomoniopsis sp. IMI 355080]